MEIKQQIPTIEPEKLVLINDKENPLFDTSVNAKPDENFVLNVMAYGVKEPVLVRKNGDKLEVVAGRKRTLAAIEANKRFKAKGEKQMKIRYIVETGDEKQMVGIMALENEAREEKAPMERAKLAQRMRDMGATDEEIALAFGKPKSHIAQLFALFDCAPEVRKEVEANRLSVSGAAKLAKLPKEEQATALKEAEAAHNAAKANGAAHKSSRKIAVRHVKRASEKKRGVAGKDSDAGKPPKYAVMKSMLIAGGLNKECQEVLAWAMDGTVVKGGAIEKGIERLKEIEAKNNGKSLPPKPGDEVFSIKKGADGKMTGTVTVVK